MAAARMVSPQAATQTAAITDGPASPLTARPLRRLAAPAPGPTRALDRFLRGPGPERPAPEAPDAPSAVIHRATVPANGPRQLAAPRLLAVTPGEPPPGEGASPAPGARIAASPPPAPPAASLPPAPPPAYVQRALSAEQDLPAGTIAAGEPEAPKVDIDKLADEVWQRLHRRLRIERERERGLP